MANPQLMWAQNQLKAELATDVLEIRAKHSQPAMRVAAMCGNLTLRLAQATGIPVNDLNEIVMHVYEL